MRTCKTQSRFNGICVWYLEVVANTIIFNAVDSSTLNFEESMFKQTESTQTVVNELVTISKVCSFSKLEKNPKLTWNQNYFSV